MMLPLLIAGAMSGFFYQGGDPSEIPQVEASGAIYKVRGQKVDPLVAMKQAGWTAIRLRIWNSPSRGGYCDLQHTLAMAKRAHDAGLRVMLDFHYSDWWADPQKQNKPEAWKSLSFPDLQKALHDYSRDVVKALVDQGTPADVVQPGNEITNGLLWPDGKLEINKNGWPNVSLLLKAAVGGIKDGAGDTHPKIMIHLDQGGDNDVSRLWLDNYFKLGGDLDIVGLSYYPQWHGSLKELEINLNDLARRYKKDVMVAETAYPYGSRPRRPTPPVQLTQAFQLPGPTAVDPVQLTGYPATPEGQADFVKRLLLIVRHVNGHHGVGVLWWAPAQIPPPGRTGFGGGGVLFDTQGEALPAFFALGSN